MERRNIVLGFITLAVIALVIFIAYKNSNKPTPITNLPSPGTEQKLESKFNLTIPDDVEKAELASSSSDSTGVATRTFEAGLFSLTVLADLPDSTDRYHAWLVRGERGDENYTSVFMGNLSVAKGGFILNYDVSKDLNDHKTVIVTSGKSGKLEEETVVLQGNFK